MSSKAPLAAGESTSSRELAVTDNIKGRRSNVNCVLYSPCRGYVVFPLDSMNYRADGVWKDEGMEVVRGGRGLRR